MADVTGVPAQRYKLAMYGGGIEELDRFGVRDRIRSGEITAGTELAFSQTDVWNAAASYPELQRYFEMAAVTTRQSLTERSEVRAEARPVESMRQRLLNGLVYPVGGGEVILLLGLAVLSAIPLIGILGTLASTLMMVEIVRTSAEGRTKLPLIDTSQIWQLVRTYLRVLFVTVVSLLPVLIFGIYAIGRVLTRQMSMSTAVFGVVTGLAFSAVYYPACLATVAVWDSVLDSLNPMYIARLIRRIGGDYFLVIGVWFVASFVTTLLSSPFVSPFAMIPLVGGVLARALSLWSLFYVSHLLGYAVYRHAQELGWK
jgi:hypothetical protein